MQEQKKKQPAPTDSDESHDVIDRTEMAVRMSVDVRTIDRMVKRGELPQPCVGAGGRPRWLWSFVLHFLERKHERGLELSRRVRGKTGNSTPQGKDNE